MHVALRNGRALFEQEGMDTAFALHLWMFSLGQLKYKGIAFSQSSILHRIRKYK